MVKSLYSTEGLDPPGSEMDPEGLISKNVTSQGKGGENTEDSIDYASDLLTFRNAERTQEIPILLPQGASVILSCRAGDTLRLIHERGGKDIIIKAKVRGMAKTFPGFFFSSYRQVAGFLQVPMSFDSVYNIIAMTVNSDFQFRISLENWLRKEHGDDW